MNSHNSVHVRAAGFSTSTQGRWALAAITVAMLGCSSGDKPATQVAAKVNGAEISVHQINAMLQRANVSQEQLAAASSQVLERLVDQELLVQKATERKLDRDPQVMQSLEAAKREILARAYLEKVGATATAPSEADIKDFYTKHPELFAERRVYSFREITIAVDAEKQKQLQAQLSAAKSLDEVFAWLKTENIPFRVNMSVKAAEQLPMPLAARIHQMKDGQIGVLPGAGGVGIVQLISSRQEPVDEAKARQFIERYLTTQRRTELAQAEVKAVRTSAKVEYVGEFGNKAASAASAPAAAESGKGTAPAAPTAQDAAELEKGIAAGIK